MKYLYDIDLGRFRNVYGERFADMSDPEREASLFRLILEKIPVHITDTDIFAGWYGFESEEELADLYQVSIEDLYPKKTKKPKKSAAEMRSVDWLTSYGFNPGGYDRKHYGLDYKKILSRGTNDYIREVEQELQKETNTSEKNYYLKAMLISLSGIEYFAGKFASLAEKLSESASDASDKERLLRIASACRKVPMLPPENFFEAIQSTFLLRALVCISSFTCTSVSIGTFDQLLYPYYKASKEQGMTDEEVIQAVVQFFRMLTLYGGRDCALSIGGVDENDNDLTNELTYLIVEAEKRSKLIAPIFVARINKNTPKKLMRALISKELFEMGQPSFYSEENCRAAVIGRGIDPVDARTFQISSCMTLIMAGREATHGWGCMVNTHLPLELALNGGKPIVGEFGLKLKTEPKTDYTSIDEIFSQYKKYMTELFDVAMDWNQRLTEKSARTQPDVLLSAFTDDCIKAGKDRWDGGAIYHNLIIEMMGFANTADAITAIDRYVFKEKKYTIADFIEAVKDNYVGHDELYRDLKNCEKYGENKDVADKNARKLLDINAEVCEAKRCENRRYLPSLHTLWSDVYWGETQHAYLDGRLSGAPVNKNAGPSTATRKTGPTNIILSAGKIDQVRYSGGQALDIHISVTNMDNEEKKDKIAALIKTYFDFGGLQIQVNGLSVETLEKAYEMPEDYPDLMVRIGGHSRYFNEFTPKLKRDFIERFKVEEGSFK